jgi:hypothetical protein
MAIPPEIEARLLRAVEEIRETCARENLSFVLVTEPIDVRTGVFLITESDENSEDALCRMRVMLMGAVERLANRERHAVIEVDAKKPSEGDARPRRYLM